MSRNTLEVMRPAHSSKRPTTAKHVARIQAASGLMVTGVTGADAAVSTLAVAAAAMAADETRSYGRLKRAAAKRLKGSESGAAAADLILNRLLATEPSYAVAGQLSAFAAAVERAAAVVETLSAAAAGDAGTLALATAGHAVWSAYVSLPSSTGDDATPTDLAYEWAASVARRKTVSVTLSNGSSRQSYSWTADATGDALRLLRRDLLKRSPLVARLNTTAGEYSRSDAIERQISRAARRMARVNRRRQIGTYIVPNDRRTS